MTENLEPMGVDDHGNFYQAADNVPKDYPFLDDDGADIVCAITGHCILRGLKANILNIIEGCGMPESQERAVKRMAVNALLECQHDIRECVDLATKK